MRESCEGFPSRHSPNATAIFNTLQSSSSTNINQWQGSCHGPKCCPTITFTLLPKRKNKQNTKYLLRHASITNEMIHPSTIQKLIIRNDIGN